MSSPKSFQMQQNFTPYRPMSPKLGLGQGNQTQSHQYSAHLITQQKGKNNSHSDAEHLTSIHYENNLLRE
jgi:hypothetical protein